MNNKLKETINSIAANPDLNSATVNDLMSRAFALAETPEERKEAGQLLVKAIGNRKRPDVDVKSIMGELTETLNLSYISKRYFNKNRTWLYQRLNKSIVNGKPAAFSQAELNILADSLNQISDNIRKISVQLTH